MDSLRLALLRVLVRVDRCRLYQHQQLEAMQGRAVVVCFSRNYCSVAHKEK